MKRNDIVLACCMLLALLLTATVVSGSPEGQAYCPANGPWVLLFCLIDMRRVRRNDHELPKSNFVSCIVYLDRASTTQAIDHHCGGNALSAFDVVMGS